MKGSTLFSAIGPRTGQPRRLPRGDFAFTTPKEASLRTFNKVGPRSKFAPFKKLPWSCKFLRSCQREVKALLYALLARVRLRLHRSFAFFGFSPSHEIHSPQPLQLSGCRSSRLSICLNLSETPGEKLTGLSGINLSNKSTVVDKLVSLKIFLFRQHRHSIKWVGYAV